MFIEQGVKPENKFWKYILGSLLIILASTVGQIPLVLAIFIKNISDGKGFSSNTEDWMTLLDSNLTLFLVMVSFVFAIVGIFLVVKYVHQQPFIEVTTSRKKVDWNRILFSFSIWSLFTIVSTVIMYYNNPENFVLNFKPIPFLILALVAVVMIPIQTSTEEYVFRGYLMQGFGNLALNKWFPLVMTSVIFGSMHILNPEVNKMGYIVLVYYIGTGFLMGIMTLMDEGMELSLGFHAANNLVGALLVTADWSVFQTNSILKDISEPTAGFDVILPVIVVYPILLFIFSKKYHWTNWVEKLTGTIANPNIITINILNENKHDSDLS
ncbi:CPBP family intramembrane glutamic endopeptidase [Flavobacterium psychrotolerans]|uniref:CPBP family intramembrane metalloprotease domain-containing protein n=1 Tax=Flavobacterium psychrotolerans TaxID=2169410 RepID=A0A2U1JHP2_9FLAO|nr:CPBP family intramembrane glutamic endopeptidase [Flavobacterium psychrotolerans]PWA04647.1 CPBP family intramembrane metalloprotease domain-containing protein [Flavobacterium psychrotolerans]